MRELLAAGRRPVFEVWMAEDLDPSPVLDEIETLAGKRHARLQLVPPRRRLEAEARTDAPQGVLARAGALGRPISTTSVRPSGVVPFLVVFDGVTDPHNLGSLLRSAECAGVSGVVVPRHRSAHVTPTVTKVAAGAVEHLAMAVVPGIPSALQRMAQAGITTVGLDASADVSLFISPIVSAAGASMSRPPGSGHRSRRQGSGLTYPASVLGAGLDTQHGSIESFNVASAGAVAFLRWPAPGPGRVGR